MPRPPAPLAAALAGAVLVVVGAPGSTRAEPPPSYGLLEPVRRGAVVLRHGATGDRVRALQEALTAAGEAVAPSGVFAWDTWVALRRFQARTGCSVDGAAGPETVRALDRVLGAAPAPAPAPMPGPPSPPGPAAAGVPARPAGAPTGSQFLRATRGLSRAAREEAIRRELLAGNVPDFLRRLATVTAGDGLAGAIGPGGARLVVRVLPDYLAIGTDADFVRIPMGAPTAQAVADAWGYLLPTRRLVDLVWRQAAVRLRPSPLPPGALMMSNDYFATHQARVEAARAGQPLGALTAGHKKDVVVTPRLRAQPGRVAIYGWHQPSGQPIQPLSLVHEATYADYSHGVRLVAPDVELDGRPARLADVLADPATCGLASDEGPVASPRYR